MPPRLGWPADKAYGAIGSLQVRLADSRRDLHLAQRLRYQVFFEEMSAAASLTARMRRRDEDAFDAVCDHFLVVDMAPKALPGEGSLRRCGLRRGGGGGKPLVVGTYRVLRRDVARQCNRPFYTEGEYDIAPLLAAKGPDASFMELGRSCVMKPYRNRRTLELLWHGLWTYVRQHRVEIMIGCASFQGTDPGAHAMALSFLHHNCRAPADWVVRAHGHLYQAMNLLPAGEVDGKAALKAMPPLIKAYLRLGAYIGDGAVIDRAFGTTDVLVILPVARIDSRYFAHFGAPDEMTARIARDVKPAS